MTILSHTYHNKDLTVFKVLGLLSFEKVMPVIKEFYHTKPTKFVLWDLTDVKEVQIVTEQIEAIVNYKPRYEGKRKPGKTALVAQRDLLFGLSRMFQIESNVRKVPHNIRVFRSINEAHEWLEKF